MKERNYSPEFGPETLYSSFKERLDIIWLDSYKVEEGAEREKVVLAQLTAAFDEFFQVTGIDQRQMKNLFKRYRLEHPKRQEEVEYFQKLYFGRK
jgi:hypothetical protein